MQLAKCWKPRVSVGTRSLSHPVPRVYAVSSDNPFGAANQQERPGFEQWVVGFVDGESVFEAYPLRTAKRDEFGRFAGVVRLMIERRHLMMAGLIEIAHVAQTMNHRKPSRFLESSEAIRQPPHLDG